LTQDNREIGDGGRGAGECVKARNTEKGPTKAKKKKKLWGGAKLKGRRANSQPTMKNIG